MGSLPASFFISRWVTVLCLYAILSSLYVDDVLRYCGPLVVEGLHRLDLCFSFYSNFYISISFRQTVSSLGRATNTSRHSLSLDINLTPGLLTPLGGFSGSLFAPLTSLCTVSFIHFFQAFRLWRYCVLELSQSSPFCPHFSLSLHFSSLGSLICFVTRQRRLTNEAMDCVCLLGGDLDHSTRLVTPNRKMNGQAGCANFCLRKNSLNNLCTLPPRLPACLPPPPPVSHRIKPLNKPCIFLSFSLSPETL